MTPLFKKLNFKNQKTIIVLNAPASFAPEMAAMSGLTTFQNDFETETTADFVLAFATKQAEVNAFAAQFSEKTTGDVVIWVAYPKGSSKKLKCDFNRDTGWAVFGKMGFEPVRQVAIDEDWSALRFRRVDFIVNMTRSFAMTEAGKEKSAGKTAPKIVVVPEDFAAAMEKNPAAKMVFEKYAYTHRKEYVQWIEEAKRAETRTRRIEKALEMLVVEKKLS